VGVIELVGVPFDGYGRSGHQARAAAALRGAGLAHAFEGHQVVDTGDLELPAPSPERGRDTSLINEPALLALTDALSARVAAAVSAQRFPIVVGGDCSVLFGVIAGLSDAGLVFVDGHEDSMPLDVSEDGEAANTEIGLLLGVTGGLLRGPLAQRRATLQRGKLAMLGPRDIAWRRRFNVGTLADAGVWLRDLTAVAVDPAGVARDAVTVASREGSGWWLHTDLDVLDPLEFAAQGLPDVDDEPGGLTWSQLTEILVAAIAAGGCLGWSAVIYDPDQDPDRTDAQRIIDLVSNVGAALRP
jgi:arginase